MFTQLLKFHLEELEILKVTKLSSVQELYYNRTNTDYENRDGRITITDLVSHALLDPITLNKKYTLDVAFEIADIQEVIDRAEFMIVSISQGISRQNNRKILDVIETTKNCIAKYTKDFI